MNSLHGDYFMRSGFGEGKPFRTFLRIAFVFGFVFLLMVGNGYLQARRLVGSWQSPSGHTVWQFNDDGSVRVWDSMSGWSGYYEWYVNGFTNSLHTTVRTVSRFGGDVGGFYKVLDDFFSQQFIVGGEPAFILPDVNIPGMITYEFFSDEFIRVR
ncbi:MAG: hypothetical protein FWB98_04495 [Defluviitaleaceae bacterium]|nr:hypothetical protein [Defluviitaleaceae bacterium]